MEQCQNETLSFKQCQITLKLNRSLGNIFQATNFQETFHEPIALLAATTKNNWFYCSTIMQNFMKQKKKNYDQTRSTKIFFDNFYGSGCINFNDFEHKFLREN